MHTHGRAWVIVGALAMGGCTQSCAEPECSIEGERPTQQLLIQLGDEHDPFPEGSFGTLEESCEGFDGLTSGGSVLAWTGREVSQIRGCHDLSAATSTLGELRRDDRACGAYTSASLFCAPVEIDGCWWRVTYSIDAPDFGAKIRLGSAVDTTGEPVTFTRVLVPMGSAACPELADDPGCHDTWVALVEEVE